MRFLALVSALFACACVAAPDVSSDELAIIGGEASTGNSAVVMLVGYPPDKSVLQSCTAVLVAPTVLLTAAHCVDATDHPSYIYGIFPGDDATQYDTLVKLIPHLLPVTAVHPHPSYTPTADFSMDYDIATVELQDALPVAPLPMRTTAVTPALVNTPATIIGYGQTTYMQFNQKRYQAMTVVTAVEGDTIVVGDNVKRSCLGDSGGPAIIGGEVTGIDSYGPTGCNAAAHYRRVDSYASFIGQYVPPIVTP
ncbi:MAG TPA: trypsin-like serine protease, partial [Kofleriaceae bacterium]